MTDVPLPRQLALAFKAARARVQDQLTPLGMHAGQDYLVELLGQHDGLSVTEAAERLGVEVPTVVRTVQRMEEAGLVARRSDPADRRRVLIALTERGQAARPAVRAGLDAVAAQATRGFTAAEREELSDLLARVHKNLAD